MKRILLFFICFSFFLFSFMKRYQPISLDRIQPTTKTVEVKGEVKNPGVYTVKYEATVEEVLKQAGGLTKQADISSISLVREVSNQEVIVIDEIREEKKISLNTATMDELVTLPGIGPSMAQRIMDYRNEKPFSSIEEIMEVKGIKEGIFNKIKDHICL